MSTPVDWSKIWLIVGIGGGALLAAVNITWWIAQERAPIPGPMHTLIVAVLMVLTMGSWNGMRERRIRRETENRVAVIQTYFRMVERSQTFVGRATIAPVANPHAEVSTEAIEMPAATVEPTHPPRRRRRRRAASPAPAMDTNVLSLGARIARKINDG